MKKVLLSLAGIFLMTNIAISQTPKEYSKLPSIDIKKLDGKAFNTRDISNNGKPIILSFWATWCKPCLRELNTIHELYPDWQEETGVKLIAVSIDDSRSSARVLPMVNGSNWDYEILLDANSDFKRSMGVNNIPHTFLINGNGEIVWQHTSFVEGSELRLIDLVRKLSRGEDISNEK